MILLYVMVVHCLVNLNVTFLTTYKNTKKAEMLWRVQLPFSSLLHQALITLFAVFISPYGHIITDSKKSNQSIIDGRIHKRPKQIKPW